MLNIEIRYQTIAKFGISHQYFNTQIPKGTFPIVPTQSTRRLCEKMGMLVLKNNQDIALAFDNDKDDAMLYYLENNDQVKFSFYIYSENVLFKNFTNFPLENQNFIYYFNNQTIDNEKQNLIHTNSSTTAKDLLELKQNFLEIKPKTKVSLKNIFNTEILTTKNEGDVSFSLYFDKLEEGKYTIFKENKKTQEFLYLKPTMKRNPIAFVEIILGDKEKKILQDTIKGKEKIEAFDYRINFANRHTFWRYFIVPKYSNGIKHLIIETQGETIKFANAKETILPNTDLKAYMFETNQSLALQQRYAHDFELIRTKDSKGKNVKQVLEKLPYPNIDILKPASKKADAKIFSDIIVYI